MKVNIKNCLVLALALTLSTSLICSNQAIKAEHIGLSGGLSVSTEAGSSGGSGGSDGARSTGSSEIIIGSSTSKPLLDKVKDMFKEGKDIIKNTVETIKEDKPKVSIEGSVSSSSSSPSSSSSSPSSSSSSASLEVDRPSSSLSAQTQASSSGGQSSSGSGSAQASVSITTSKPGLLEKISEFAKKTLGGESGSNQSVSAQASSQSSDSSSSSSSSSSASVQVGTTSKPSGLLSKISDFAKKTLGGESESSSASLQVQAQSQAGGSSESQTSVSASSGGQQRSEGLMDKVTKVVSKGAEKVREGLDKIEDKAYEVRDKVKSDERNSGESRFSQHDREMISAEARYRGPSVQGEIQVRSGERNSGESRFSQHDREMISAEARSRGPSVQGEVQVRSGEHNGGEYRYSQRDREMIPAEARYRGSPGQSEVQVRSGEHNGGEYRYSQRDRDNWTEARSRGSPGQSEVQVKSGSGHGGSKSSVDVKVNSQQQRKQQSSSFGNNQDPEKTVAVEVMDKAHEESKIPVENILKPIDKMLGVEKDPLLQAYDQSYEIIRKPVGIFAKPVESFFSGAFKTTDETRREQDRLMSRKSDYERKEAQIREDKARKEDRSVIGEIADKTVDLYTKPIEIVLKPLDKVLGYDKDGKKNPILKAIDEIYGLSKKPFDSVAKPFERILKKMANNEQLYQVSIRFNTDKEDPKIVTRLTDGALNIADRVVTKPMEIVLKPLDHVLGYDEPGKKDPLVEATHSLKNATKVGFELFTKPIDRIIKEIAEIGDYKSESEREAAYQHQRDEASRIVKALDKLHEMAQAPFEIVLKPINQALGLNPEGKKEPLLRAWDVIHQVVRTPIQVISVPVEDAIFGDGSKRGEGKSKSSSLSIGGNIGGFKAQAQVSTSAGSSQSRQQQQWQQQQQQQKPREPARKNLFIEGIKDVEKIATRPIEKITSPIRKLILDENEEGAQAKAKVGNAQVSVQAKGERGPDKIVKTLEKMNNVVLKPLEIVTQPISDMLSKVDGVKGKIELKSQGSSGGFQAHAQVQSKQPSKSSQSSASAQAQVRF